MSECSTGSEPVVTCVMPDFNLQKVAECTVIEISTMLEREPELAHRKSNVSFFISNTAYCFEFFRTIIIPL